MTRKEVIIAGISVILLGCLTVMFFGGEKNALPIDPAWLASLFFCIGLAAFGYAYYFMK